MAITKKQKIWMWVFGAMFLVPEILFLNIIVFLAFFFRIDMPSIISLLFGVNDLNPIIFLSILFIEIIGVLGLFVLCVKLRERLFYIVLGIILLWLFYIFCLSIGFSRMSLVW